jgi:hypothetical protein
MSLSCLTAILLLSPLQGTQTAPAQTAPTKTAPGQAAAPAQASGQKYQLSLKFVPNQVDNYKLTMSQSDGSGFTAFVSDKVSKAYPNGDADLTETTKSQTFVRGGRSQDLPGTPAPIDFKVSKYGLFIGKAPNSPIPLLVLTMALPGENKGVPLNGTIEFTRSLPTANSAQVGPSVEGIARLAEVSDGIAKVVVQGRFMTPIANPQAGLNTFKGNLTWDMKNERLTHADLTIITKPVGPPNTIQISIDRVP